MKAPIIVLIILLFVAIFLYGSVLEPYTGEGLYYGRVQSTTGTQWLDTIIRFEEPEGGRQVFTMYNIIFETGEEDSPVESMTKITVQYSGSYFKHVFGPLFLRPTGIHFPVIDFEGHDKFVMNWQPVEAACLDGEGEPMVDYEYSTAPISTTRIEDLLLELRENYTIIMVTHNMQQAARISDRTAFFLSGEVVECAETDRLFSNPGDKRTEEYITGRFG